MRIIKKLLIYLSRHNIFFRKLKQHYQKLRDWFFWTLPIDNKLIVFESFRSTKYADSPKAIYEYLIQHEAYRSYRFIWIFEHPKEHSSLKNSRTRIVKHESLKYYLAFARSKYWVVNGWIPLRIKKKPNQIALQCWHGTPLKRLRYDIINKIPTKHQEKSLLENDEDMLRYDYIISPSGFTTKVFKSAFNLSSLNKEDAIIEIGYPRNDALVNASESDRKKGRAKYQIPENKKVLLYAPTWRDDQYRASGGYEYKTSVDFDELQKKLSDDWVILFRAHNLVANSFNFSLYDGFIRDVSGLNDINELYSISDALMTDYSSVFFDYAILKRPIIFFMYDLEHYKNNLRGFYLKLEDLPGEIVQNEAGVINCLSELDRYKKRYTTKQQRFHDKYNKLDDGKATSRAVKILLGNKYNN